MLVILFTIIYSCIILVEKNVYIIIYQYLMLLQGIYQKVYHTMPSLYIVTIIDSNCCYFMYTNITMKYIYVTLQSMGPAIRVPVWRIQ